MTKEKISDSISKLEFVPNKRIADFIEFLHNYENMVALGLTKKRESKIFLNYSNSNSNFHI